MFLRIIAPWRTEPVKSSNRIIVIEDEPALLNLLIMLLKRSGFDAIGFQKGLPALDYISKNRVDLVLADIILPDIDGIKICESIKSKKRSAQIPVVLVTSAPTKKMVIAAKKAGAQEFISKINIDFDGFLKNISEILEQSKQQSAIDRSPGKKTIAPTQKADDRTSAVSGSTGTGKTAGPGRMKRTGQKQSSAPHGKSAGNVGKTPGKKAKQKKGPAQSVSRQRSEAVISALKRIKELRTLPFLALELARKASNQESSASDLLKVVEMDQALTYKILRVANSATFSSSKKINSLREAIVRIGFDKVKEIALGATILDNIGEKAGTIDRVDLWKHSLASSIIARELASLAGGKNQDIASIAAFLHDFGKAVFDDFFEKPYEEAARYSKSADIPFHTSEMRLLGIDHASLFHELRVTWKLPDKLYSPIIHHHNTWEELKQLGMDDQVSKLILIVKTANILAKATGIGNSGDDHLTEIPSHVKKILQIDADVIEGLLTRAESTVIDLKEALSVKELRKASLESGDEAEFDEKYFPDTSPSEGSPDIAWIDNALHSVSPFRLFLTRSGVKYSLHKSLAGLVQTLKNGGDKPDIIFSGPETSGKVWQDLHNFSTENSEKWFDETRFVLLHHENRDAFKTEKKSTRMEVIRTPISKTRLRRIILSSVKVPDPAS